MQNDVLKETPKKPTYYISTKHIDRLPVESILSVHGSPTHCLGKTNKFHSIKSNYLDLHPFASLNKENKCRVPFPNIYAKNVLVKKDITEIQN